MDIIGKLANSSEPEWSRENALVRLMTIEQACRTAIKSYRKTKPAKKSKAIYSARSQA